MNPYRKWIDLFLILGGVLVWFVFNQIFHAVWGMIQTPWNGWGSLKIWNLLAIVSAAVVFFGVKRSLKVTTFLDEVSQELAKVVWPNQKETVASTGVIIVMVSIVSVLLFVFDTFWGTLTKSFFAL